MKTVAENEILQDALTKVTPGPLIGFGGLTIAPLLRFDAADPDWLTLDEAIAAGSLTVTEVSQAGSVPTLRVVNGGERAVLLLDSEELVGAKQNRVLNTSVDGLKAYFLDHGVLGTSVTYKRVMQPAAVSDTRERECTSPIAVRGRTRY